MENKHEDTHRDHHAHEHQPSAVTPEDLSVDPDLIPYLFAARTPAEPEDNNNPTGEPLDPENAAASRKGPVDRFGVSLSPEQRELVDEARERQRPTSTLGPSTMEDPKARAIYETLLTRRAEHQIEPSLEPVRGVLDYLGNPQDLFHSIHITGTNGKTSIARMIEALLVELGYRTGRFTSPHLVDVRERITVDQTPVTTEQFVQAYEDIEAQLALWETPIPDIGCPSLKL